MGTTQPIRNRQELQNFSSYYKQVKPHLRNYTLVVSKPTGTAEFQFILQAGKTASA